MICIVVDTLSDDLLQELQLVVENFITKKDIPTSTLKERKFGTMKGLITYTADGFDEPLEDFKDYM